MPLIDLMLLWKNFWSNQTEVVFQLLFPEALNADGLIEVHQGHVYEGVKRTIELLSQQSY